MCDCSTLELIAPDSWMTMDGLGFFKQDKKFFTETLGLNRFEFATNEFLNSMSCVTLETTSTETGSKEYIAVGTTIDRGEDLAAKGAVSVCCLGFDMQ
jgi:cleavage and polyadenylation specificity factor subunit 1